MAIDPSTFTGNTPTASPDIFGSSDTPVQGPDIFGPSTVVKPPSEAEITDTKRKLAVASIPDADRPPIVQVDAMLSQGRENELRSVLANNEDSNAAKIRQAIINDVIQTRSGGPITEDEFKLIYNNGPKADPQTILEKLYAKGVVDKTLGKDGGSLYGKAYEANPNVDLIVEAHQRTIEKNAILDRIERDYTKEASDQTWVGWGVDRAKEMFPLYTAAKRNKAFGAVLGGTFLEEVDNLLSITDPVEFNTRVRVKLDSIKVDNPGMAAEFAHELRKVGSNDATFMNIMTATDVLTAAQIAKDAGIAIKGVKGAVGRVAASDSERLSIPLDASGNPVKIPVNTVINNQDIPKTVTVNGVKAKTYLPGDPKFDPPANDSNVVRDFWQDRKGNLDTTTTPKVEFDREGPRVSPGTTKVVDLPDYRTGVPIVADVFHGTPTVFTKFSEETLGGNSGAKSSRMGTFFSRNPDTANFPGYTKTPGEILNDGTEATPNMHLARIKLENPAVQDWQGGNYKDMSFSKFIQESKDAGHDGAILLNTTDGGPVDVVYVVFDPKNIGVQYDAGKYAMKKNLEKLRSSTTLSNVANDNTGDRVVSSHLNGKSTVVTEGTNSAVQETHSLLSDVSSTLSKPGATIKDAVAATGDIEKAAEAGIAEGVIGKIRKVQPDEDVLNPVVDFVKKNLPEITNPSIEVENSAFDKVRQYIGRLNKTMEENAQIAMRLLFDTNIVSRIDKTPEYIGSALEQAKQAVKRQYGGNTVNSILDQKFVPGSKMGTNVDRVFTYIGKPEGTLFHTPQEAEGAIRAYGISGEPLDIVQQGDKYAIRFARDIDETDPAMRKHILYANTETPISYAKMFIGKLMSADQNLSKSQNQVRNVATNLQSETERLVNLIAKPIERLSKSEGNRLFQIMDEQAATVRTLPNGTQTKGYFFKTPVEFSTEYYTKFGEFPTQKETTAYFTAVFLNDVDYVVRSIDIFKGDAQRGLGEVSLNLTKNVKGQPVTGLSEPIKGKLIDSLPFEKGDEFTVAVVDNSGAHMKVNSRDMTTAQKKAIKDIVENGNGKIAQIADPSTHPLGDYFGKGDPVNYVVAPDIKFQNLDVSKMLPYNEGGHAIENMNWRIKSPRTGATTKGEAYFGDATFAGFTREHEAKAMVKDMEALRVAYKDAVDNAANGAPNFTRLDAELANRRMPFSRADFLEFVKDGIINKDHPFAVLRDGQKYSDAIDLRGRSLYNYTTSPHNLEAGINTAFQGERSLGSQSFERGGSNNPAWLPVKARMLDTRQSMQQSMGELLRSHVYSDYVVKSAREFIEQFGDLLVGGKEANRNAPIYNLLHPQWNTHNAVANGAEMAAAKKMQMAVTQLVYSSSELSKDVMSAKDAVLNWVYKVGGKVAGDYLEDNALFKTRDPTRFLRGMAFHSSIGLLNPVQLFLNTQTLFHMTAVSPIHAPGAFKDSVLMRFLNMNNDPQIVRAMAKKSGYQHFDEMYNEMVRSGVSDIGGTIAHLDDALDPKTINTKFGRFLDFATVFFRESEAGLRRSSYGIAYREWRSANPSAVMDDLVRQQILGRAKVLNVQMSRDSMALMQKGLMSIPLQFTSYTLRTSEQILEGALSGKGALSRAETARVMGMYSLLYGVPTAAGAALGIIPIEESFKKYAIDNGIDLDANLATTIATQGIMQAISHYSGFGKYNFAEAYGPGNNSIVSNIVSGNTTLLEAAMGPSGSMAYNMIKHNSPLTHSVGSLFSKDPDVSYPLVASDAIESLRDIKSVNLATKAWMAYQHSAWLNRSGVVQTTVDGPNAAFMALLGLTPQEAADAYPMQSILKNYNQIKTDLGKEITTEFNKAMDANTNGDDATYDAHMRRTKYLIETSGLNTTDQMELAKKMIKFHDEQGTELRMKIIKKSSSSEEMNSKLDLLEKRNKEQVK